MRKIISLYIICSVSVFVFAENIDPYQTDAQYVYAENVGWINFQPVEGSGVQVSSSAITGKIWGENIGWINLSPTTYGGVANDGNGNLSGYAWGENVGWINFDPDVPGDASNQYKVTIDADGFFSGWAYGENIGWIHFNETQSWSVQACVVALEDLTYFASYWLQSGNIPANLDLINDVDMNDYSILASYWQDFCPDGWLLKGVFPDNYDTISYSHIVEQDASLSASQIDGSDGNEFYPGTYFIYQTDEGRYGKFIVENLEPGSNQRLTIGWVTYSGDGSVYSSGTGLQINGTYLCDLDAGLESGVVGGDWHWSLNNTTTRYLNPFNGARLMLLYRATTP